MPNDPFVDVGDLPSLGPLRYLDVRDQASFDAGHAPGAVRVPLDEWDAAAKADDTGFAKTAYWDSALNALGLDPALTAVTYDSGGMTNAARVWFILQYYGLKAVIVNGGWPMLAGTTGLPPAAQCRRVSQRLHAPVPVRPRAAHCDAGPADRQDEDPARCVVPHLRAGRAALHRPHVDLLENGVVRPAAALRAILERVGFGPSDHIVTHCEGGGRAALGAAAAVRAGFADVRVYYLSFGDWVRDESCPVVRD